MALGFKTIHSAEGMTAARRTLHQVGRWIAEGRLDDGTVVSDIIVIAESRTAVEAFRPVAEAEGVRHVVCVGDDGRIWNPFPEGNWLPMPMVP